MLKSFLTLALFSFSAAIAQAQTTPITEMPSGTYTMDKSHTSLIWKVNHLGLSNYTARFTSFDGSLTFDAADPTKSKLIVMVSPMSVETDYPDVKKKDFDAKLATGKEWFNAEKFPEIKFVSNLIEKTSETKGKVHGELTFMGVTKPLTLDVTFNGAYLKQPFVEIPALGFSATTTIKRSDWGFSTYVPMIGDDVTVLIESEFHLIPVKAAP